MPARAEQVDAVGVLRETELFGSLDERELTAVATSCLRRTYGKGQYLCHQGDPGDRLFVLARGIAKVTFVSERGAEMVLATLGPHGIAGEIAILDQGPRSASVVAVLPTTALMLSRSVLLELMGAHPAVLNALLTRLGALVRRRTEQAGDLVFLDLGARLAKLLLQLAVEHGRHDGDRVVLELGLNQSELAGMVGGSRPAVNRVLHVLAARGQVEVSGHTITLCDLPALRRRAGG
ncbi:Crp/Fnr family transcriptional regulator [Actinophytocola sp.]|uniref:Crp/Fnr family transcriptional regulator n=1 Tax=Actinophytocola sp. TaxID=1872138 RepID=UPI00389A7FFB